MNKTIHFITGMPQAGTSLLSSILAQNPRFETAVPGGIFDAIYMIPQVWQKIDEFQTTPNEPGKPAVMRAMLEGYFAHSDRPIAFEKSRGWLAHLEMAELLLERKAKALVPVRDLRDILARFELLWRQSSGHSQINLERAHYVDFQSVEGRCSAWLHPEHVVGLAYARIQDAVRRGLADRMHFVPYQALTTHPRQTIAAIYDFLGEEPFDHDLEHLQQVVAADDWVFDLPNAHQTRPVLAPEPPGLHAILGSIADRYKGPYIWDLSH